MKSSEIREQLIAAREEFINKRLKAVFVNRVVKHDSLEVAQFNLSSA